nr:M56 family metallopeptidase [Thermoanaerobaculales bacterium]
MDATLPFVLGALKALVLLAAAALATLALRGRPARLRAVVWGTALLGSLLIPALEPLLPPLPVPLPEILEPSSNSSVPALRVDHPSPAASTVATMPAASSTQTAGATAVLQAAPSRLPEPRSIPWRPLAMGLWVLGGALLLARLGRGLLRVAGIVRAAEPVEDPGWQRALAHARASVGCHRRVRLLTSPEIEVPATVGFVRPTVVLPERAASWLDDRRRAVLQHECIHIARGDWPLRIVARAARAAYWFNPLTWWATRRLELEQELACDEEVLALGTGASDYACHLLGIARHA